MEQQAVHKTFKYKLNEGVSELKKER